MEQRTKKSLAAAVAGIALVGAIVGGSLAYLQDSTDTLNNTFTIGDVSLALDETVVNEYGVEVDGSRAASGNSYKLIPGHTYTKDPVITVSANSEDCYVYLKLDYPNPKNILDINAIHDELLANGWTVLTGTGSGNEHMRIYQKETAIAKSSEATEIATFTEFSIKGTVTNSSDPIHMMDVQNWNGFDNKMISVTAYAVQADGFATASDAWAATFNIQGTDEPGGK